MLGGRGYCVTISLSITTIISYTSLSNVEHVSICIVESLRSCQDSSSISYDDISYTKTFSAWDLSKIILI